MKRRFLTCLAAVSISGLVAAAVAQTEEPTKAPASQPATTKPETKPAAPGGPPPRVVLEIALGQEDWGRIVLELNEEKARGTVNNFLRYVEDGYYDGTVFHRIMPTFMIQGGGYTSLTEEKKAGLRPAIQNEARNGLKNLRGTIAMARTSAPHSATAQFFINVVDNNKLDYPGADGWGYCVFGKVIEGMDVVDRIKAVETRPNPLNPREQSQPVNPPMVKKAHRLGPDEKLPPPEPKPPTAPKPAVQPNAEPKQPGDSEKDKGKEKEPPTPE
jgi:cyclophilin family peptidyl-prolyl cis-trans isomerase